jgi:hypothetical protein
MFRYCLSSLLDTLDDNPDAKLQASGKAGN